MLDDAYVLVSACRNEEAYIDGLIDCIAAQTLRPVLWLIVDDGSTDDTYARAAARAKDLPFLKIVRMPGGRPRSFTSQVYAAQHGAEIAREMIFDFIGFLDADIRLQPDYYQRLVSFFHADRRLGLGGGVVIDQYGDKLVNVRQGSEDSHVAGGVQFFRRECFEGIGGYVPIPGGGQDTIADVMSMMHGWKLRAFTELEARHQRTDGFAMDRTMQRGMKWGRKFYLIGYHPLFYLGQCVRRLGQRPVVFSSLCQLLGFIVANIKRESRPVSDEFVRFLRKKQMERLRAMVVPAAAGKRLSDAEVR